MTERAPCSVTICARDDRYPPDPRPAQARAHAPLRPPTARSAPICTCRAAAGHTRVMVLIHGGSWHSRYGKVVMRGLAGDLAQARLGGVEHRVPAASAAAAAGRRRSLDVAAAIDHLPQVDAPLDLDRVSVLGHSAGGHLALWAAGREQLPDGAPGPARRRAASALDARDRAGRRVRSRRRLPALARRRGRGADGRRARGPPRALRRRRPDAPAAAEHARAARARDARRDRLGRAQPATTRAPRAPPAARSSSSRSPAPPGATARTSIRAARPGRRSRAAARAARSRVASSLA